MNKTHMEPIFHQFHMTFFFLMSLYTWQNILKFDWPQNIQNMIWVIYPTSLVLIPSQ